MASKTYREKRDSQKVWVLLENGNLVGVFSNLKKMFDFAILVDKDFPAYWTLARNKNQKMKYGKYTIYHTKFH